MVECHIVDCRAYMAPWEQQRSVSYNFFLYTELLASYSAIYFMTECHSRSPNIAPTGAAIVPAVVVAVSSCNRSCSMCSNTWAGLSVVAVVKHPKKLAVVNLMQCSSQSAPLHESRKRLRDGPQQKRSRAIMVLSFFNSQGLKRLCYFNYNDVPFKHNFYNLKNNNLFTQHENQSMNLFGSANMFI